MNISRKSNLRVFVLWNATAPGRNETFSHRALLLHMCDQCAPLDKKIEHYQKLLLGIADQLTLDRIKSLIADLQAQKTALHPEQEQ